MVAKRPADTKSEVCMVDLALKLNKVVHDKCKDVPHDIGMELAKIADEYAYERTIIVLKVLRANINDKLFRTFSHNLNTDHVIKLIDEMIGENDEST